MLTRQIGHQITIYRMHVCGLFLTVREQACRLHLEDFVRNTYALSIFPPNNYYMPLLYKYKNIPCKNVPLIHEFGNNEANFFPCVLVHWLKVANRFMDNKATCWWRRRHKMTNIFIIRRAVFKFDVCLSSFHDPEWSCAISPSSEFPNGRFMQKIFFRVQPWILHDLHRYQNCDDRSLIPYWRSQSGIIIEIL